MSNSLPLSAEFRAISSALRADSILGEERAYRILRSLGFTSTQAYAVIDAVNCNERVRDAVVCQFSQAAVVARELAEQDAADDAAAVADFRRPSTVKVCGHCGIVQHRLDVACAECGFPGYGDAPQVAPVARVLSSVAPLDVRAQVLRATPAQVLRDEYAGEFISSVANGYLSGATFGASAARYVVGGFATAVVLRLGADRAERTAAAIEFVATRGAHLIGAWDGVGYWRDDVTGRVWLDAVRCYAALSDALSAARDNGELAIYDTRDDVSIAVTR